MEKQKKAFFNAKKEQFFKKAPYTIKHIKLAVTFLPNSRPLYANSPLLVNGKQWPIEPTCRRNSTARQNKSYAGKNP